MRTQIIDKSVVVSAIEGNVEIVLADGSSRPLQKGEILQPGAKLTIADDAKLALSPYDDTPAQNSPTGSESVEPGQPQGASPTEGAPSDIAALQQSILQGVDPTQNFEASAAGGAPAAGGGGGIGGVAGASGNGGFVTIDRTGDATIAEAGFDTTYDTGVVINENQAEDLILENQLDDLSEAVVTLEDSQVSGNLLENSTNPDGPADASIVSYDWGINIGVPAGVAATITGVGTLSINPDGSYTFTPAPNYDGAVPPINYQVTDGQDTVTSTLVISITPVDEEVDLAGLDREGGEVQVSDTNLADGSAPNAAALTQSGVFTFNAPDGVQSLTLGGVTLITDGQLGASFPQSIISPLGNVLTITAVTYNPATGEGQVSYSYTLGDNENHTRPVNDTSLSESFSVVLIDSDGDTASDTLDVTILDDIPTLADGEEQSVRSLVHEDALTSGNSEGSGQSVSATGLAGTLNGLVNFGADGAGSFGLGSDVSSLEGQALTSGGVALNYSVAGNVLTASAGSVPIFTLTVGADGSYSFTLSGPLDHPVADGNDSEQLSAMGIDFSGVLTATDGDGDPLTGGFPAGSFAINVEDDVPVLAGGEEAQVRVAGQVHEDALTSGNSEGSGQSVSATGLAGTLNGLVNFGADGAGSFGLGSDVSSLEGQALTSGGVALNYSVAGNVLTASAGSVPIFTLTVGADGSYSFTLSGPLDHPVADGNDSEQLSAMGIDFSGVLTATDGDGDPLTGGFPAGSFAINVEDDVPVLAGGEEAQVRVAGQVHEDALTSGNSEGSGQSVSATGLAGTLNGLVNFGADGAGSFGLGSDVSSLEGQALTSGGVALNYSVAGNVLTASAGSVPIFTLTVGADGSYSFTLSGPLDHPVADGNDSEQLSAMGIDFSGVLTATDGDGDPLTGGFPAGSFAINVEDDVPVLAGGEEAQVRVAGQVHEDALTSGNSEGSGQSVSATGLAGTLNGLVNFGADGAGSFGLGSDVSSLEGQALTSGGVALNYSVAGNVLTASAGSVPIFTLTVGADGSYSFTLSGPLDHPVADGNDSEQLSAMGIDFSGVLTATDGDGDPLTGGFPAGSFAINVEDDVPVLAGGEEAQVRVAGQVHEDALTSGNSEGSGQSVSATGLAGTLNGLVNFGADGAGSFGLGSDVSSLEGQALTSGGVALNYSVAGNVLTASAGSVPIFTLTVGADGSYSFTLSGPLDHPVADGNDSEQLSAMGIDFSGVLTATDGDGDPLTGGFPAGSFAINVEDDVPVLAGGEEAQVRVAGQVHEDALTSGNSEGSGQSVSATGLAGTLNGLVNFGADGAGSFGLGSDVSSLEGQALTSGGVALNYSVAGNVLTASAGSVPIFTLTVGADGSYSFTLSGPLDHPVADGNDSEQLSAMGIDFSGVLTATDGDGDPLTGGFPAGSFAINVEDDVPVLAGGEEAQVRVAGQVHEDALTSGNSEGSGQSVSATGLAGTLNGLVNFGADGAGSFGLGSDVSSLEGQALTSGGVALNYSVAGNVLTASAGSVPIFTLTVGADGSYSFTLSGPLDHPVADGNDSEQLSAMGIDFSGVLTATDGDGDPLTGGFPAGSFAINVEDDVPVLAGGEEAQVRVAGQVHEDALTSGNSEGSGQSVSATGLAGTLNGLVNFGADGAGSFGLGSDVSSLEGQALTSGGVALNYSVAGNVLTASAGSVPIFTLTVGADGSYSFTLSGPLDHPVADGNDSEQLSAMGIDFSGVLTATDGDGDPLTGGFPAGSFAINVEDDVPVLAGGEEAQVRVAGQVHEDALTSGNSEGSGQSVSATGLAGTLNGLVNFGADGAGSFGLGSDVSSLEGQALTSGGVALNYSVAGNVLTASAGSVPIFTLTVGADGSYSFTLSGPLDHPVADGNDSEQLSAMGIDFSGVLTATDGDGDPLTGGFPAGSFAINVEDDVPVLAGGEEAQVRVAGQVHEDALTSGNSEGSGQSVSATGLAGTLNGLVNFGADGAGSFGLGSDVSSLEGQALTSGGVALNYSVAGNVLTASAGSVPIFTLTVGADGSYSFTLSGPLDHPVADGNDSEQLSAMGIDFSGVLTATDGDGDPLTGGFPAGSFAINVEDDVPVLAGGEEAQVRVAGQVHEDALTSGNSEGSGQSVSATGLAGTLNGLVNFGADGAGSFGLGSDVSSLEGQALTSGGVALNYSVAGNVLTASAGSVPIFTLTVGADGSYSFTLSGPLDHPVADGNDSEQLSAMGIDFSGVLTATDGDGDPLTGGFPAGSFAINVEDDVPTLTISDPDGASLDGTTAVVETAANISGGWALVKGADGVMSVTVSVDGQASQALSLADAANTVTFNTASGTLTVKADGSWTFDPKPVDNDTDPADVVNFSISGTDADGDPFSDTQTINVLDGTGPGNGNAVTLDLDEDDLLAGSGTPKGPLTDSATVTFVAGSDPFAGFAFQGTSGITVNVNGATGDDLFWTLDSGVLNAHLGSSSGTIVLTVSLVSANPAAGTVGVSAELKGALPHAIANGENTITITGITVVASDVDGDSATAAVTVNVVDDMPTLTISDPDGASLDGTTAVVETAANISGGWALVKGADGVMSVTVSVDGQASQALSLADAANTVTFNTASGTLTVKADGSWTFDPKPVDNDTDPADVVNFSISGTDADGDPFSDTQTINVLDGTGPGNGNAVTLDLDEDDLLAGSGTPKGPLTDNATVNFVAGSDPFAGFAFQGTSGITVNVNGATGDDLFWTLDSGVLNAHLGSSSGTIVLTVSLVSANPAAGTVGVSAELKGALPHAIANGENTITITGITVVASDVDGDSATAAVTVNVVDDMPTLTISDPDGASLDGTTAVVETAANISGGWALVKGADGVMSVTVSVDGQASQALSLADAANTVTFNTASGTLTVKADGSWTFDPKPVDNDTDPADVVNFSISGTDADGDPFSDTQTINVLDGTGPGNGNAVTLDLDEDDLLAGSGTPKGPLTDSATVTFVAGSDPFAGFAFQGTSGITVNVNGATGDDLFWTLDSGVLNAHLGSSSGTIVLTVSLVSANPAAGTVGVSAELKGALPHAIANGENTITITGITVVASDVDGDSATAAVTVNVVDDMPTLTISDPDGASLDGTTAVVETAANISGGWALVKGADGVMSVTVSVDGQASQALSLADAANTVTFNTASGTLTVKADGSWTFDPKPVDNDADPADVVNFSISGTDADGDPFSDTQTINVLDGTGPGNGNAVTLDLDEDDLLAGSGTPKGPLTDSATVTFVAGSDPFAGFAFQGTSGITVNVNGATGDDLFWTLDSGVLNAHLGSSSGTIVLTVSLVSANPAAGTVGVSAELKGALPHAIANGENTITITGITVVASDVDGDSATAAVTVNVVDDMPTLTISDPDGASLDGTTAVVETAANISGGWALVKGADGVMSVTVSVDGQASQALSLADAANTVTFNTASGTLTVKADGSWTFDPKPVDNDTDPADVVNFSISGTDADGDPFSDTQTINVLDGTGPGNGNAVTLDLDEDDLLAGSGTPKGPLTDSATVTFVAGSDPFAGFAFQGTSGITVNVNGATGDDLFWTLDSGVLNAHLGSSSGTIVLTVSLVSANPAAGTVGVSAELKGALPHAIANGENTITITGITVVASDVDGDSATAAVTVNVVDDVPTAANQTQSGQAAVNLNSNLLIVLDVSGSMGYDSGVGSMDRLQVAKNSLLELLEQYDALGDVRVSFVTFSSGADVESTWVTVAAAKAAILATSADGNTNYDEALIDAINVYDDAGKLATGNVQNVAYFLSDGFPNRPSGDAGISNVAGSAAGWPTQYSNGGVSEEQAWINFLTDNNIRAYALGMGNGVNATALDPIAYNGTPSGGNTNAIEVDDLNDLTATLVAIAQASPIPGNLTSGGGFGADGGFVGSLAIAGKTYTYDKLTNTFVASGPGANNGSLSGNVLTVTMGGGSSIAVNMLTGSYTYTPPSAINSIVVATIAFTLIDNDGDAASANLNINITPGQGAMVIRDDLVLTNVNTQLGEDVIYIPTWALLANDTGPNSGLLSVFNVTDGTSDEVDLVGSAVVFTENSDSSSNGGSFSYNTSINGSTALDSAVVDVTRSAGSNTLNGTFRNEILLGRDGSADKLNGGDGDDVLIGLGGNDTLDGGSGNDILAGGLGNDTLIGGTGVDTATYIDIGALVTVSLNTELQQNTSGAGQDTISGIENLIGSNFGDTLTGNGSANVLFGAGGNDTLVGLGGDDVLIGGEGIDLLVGGSGNDMLTGGSGKDTFKWGASDAGGVDVIKDFTTGAGGDVLDLRELLTGEQPIAGSLDAYLNFSSDGAGKSTLTIDLDGTSGGTSHVIKFDSIDLTTLGNSDLQIIQKLLDDGNLKVDP
ncbi:structural toxin protein RtxA [Aeromonas veronii]|nr:structural toxin protein RtxA [Aeromonas veronii]